MKTKVVHTRANIGNQTFAFQRRTIPPLVEQHSKLPAAQRPSIIPEVVRSLFASKVPEPAPRPIEEVTTQNIQVLGEAWGFGKEVSRPLERKTSVYFSNPKKAQEMSLVFWMQSFKWFLDVHAIPNTPASEQKGRIIKSAESAILSFSSRCVAKAARLQIVSNEAEKEKLKEISLFLKRLAGMLSEEGDGILQNDIDSLDKYTGVIDKPPRA